MILHALALQLSPTLVHIECVNRSNDIECSGFMICDKYVFEMICPLVVKVQAVLIAVELSLFMFGLYESLRRKVSFIRYYTLLRAL